ncbi:MAG: protein kinase domain-containing protein [Acidimicrobiales bacterium]
MVTRNEIGIEGLDDVERINAVRSSVYQARQTTTDQRVAVKVLDPLVEHLTPRRFDLKRRALATFAADPGVVRVLSTGTTVEGQTYLVMPHYRHGSLADRLAEGPMPWRSAAETVYATAKIVARAHELGVALGDLSPSRVLLAEGNAPVIAVYGMATRRFDDGLPDYAAPELRVGSTPTPAADVYSLSLILAALIAGRHPGRGAVPRSFIDHLGTLCPPRLVQVIEYGLAPEVRERYPSAVRFSRTLASAIDDLVSTGSRTAIGEPSAGGEAPADEPAQIQPGAPPLPPDFARITAVVPSEAPATEPDVPPTELDAPAATARPDRENDTAEENDTAGEEQADAATERTGTIGRDHPAAVTSDQPAGLGRVGAAMDAATRPVARPTAIPAGPAGAGPDSPTPPHRGAADTPAEPGGEGGIPADRHPEGRDRAAGDHVNDHDDHVNDDKADDPARGGADAAPTAEPVRDGDRNGSATNGIMASTDDDKTIERPAGLDAALGLDAPGGGPAGSAVAPPSTPDPSPAVWPPSTPDPSPAAWPPSTPEPEPAAWAPVAREPEPAVGGPAGPRVREYGGLAPVTRRPGGRGRFADWIDDSPFDRRRLATGTLVGLIALAILILVVINRSTGGSSETESTGSGAVPITSAVVETTTAVPVTVGAPRTEPPSTHTGSTSLDASPGG